MAEPMAVDAPPIFGLDIGAATTVCAKDDGELLRNELGGHTTATLVAYLDDQRCLGEAAVPSLSSKPKNTVTHVGRYACLPPDASALWDLMQRPRRRVVRGSTT